MKKVYTGLMACAVWFLAMTSMQAQRYEAEIFNDVEVNTETYGQNINVLTGAPELIPLAMDVYTPVGDTEVDRPLILIAHTGSFLPPIINGTTSGDRGDSTSVEVAKRLARRGYVAAIFTYRQGWNPVALEQDVRTSTLLQAAYRGIQDTRTCIRYWRQEAIDGANKYNIDESKIGVWGVGTGGYLSSGAATIDEYEEYAGLDKFIGADLLPYVDTSLLGNPYGTTTKPLCVANHVGYNDDFSIAVNMGGALGDISWLDGKENEPAFVGVHCYKDPFGPWHDGAVIVPTTLQFVVNVSGTRSFIEAANTLGNNDVLKDIPAMNDPLAAAIELEKSIIVPRPPAGDIFLPLGTDNMYSFVTDSLEGSPWDWWDDNIIRLKVAGINATLGTEYDADQLLINARITNWNASAEKARAYIDTIFYLVEPRLCKALELPCSFLGVDKIPAAQVDFKLAPNPASGFVKFSTASDYPMQRIEIRDMTGRVVYDQADLKSNFHEADVQHLSSAVYITVTHMESGVVIDRLVIE